MPNVMYGSSTKERTLKPGSLMVYIHSLQEIIVGRSQASSKWGRDEEWSCELLFHMTESVRNGLMAAHS